MIDYEFTRSVVKVDVLCMMIFACCFSSPRDLQAEDIFWTDSGSDSVQTAFLDGSGITDIASGIVNGSGLRGIAADASLDSVYWSNEIGELWRANLDGSSSERILNVGASDIAIDRLGEKLYWASRGDGLIQRSDLDGANVETLVAGRLRGLALDLPRDLMYWVDPGGGVMRANLNGEDIESVVTSNIGFLETIAVSHEDGSVFWVDSGRGEIRRMDSNGNNIEVVVSGSSHMRGIAYDPVNDHIYWTNRTGFIGRADSDGSNPGTFISGLGSPRRLSIATTGDLTPDEPVIIVGQGGVYRQDFDSMGVRRGRVIPQGWSGFGMSDNVGRVNTLGLQNMDAALPPGIVNAGGSTERFSRSGDGLVGTWNVDLTEDGDLDFADIAADAATDRALGVSRNRDDDVGALAFESVVTELPLRAVEIEWDLEVWGGDPRSVFRGADGAGFSVELVVNGNAYESQVSSLIPGTKFSTRADEVEPVYNATLIDGNLHATRAIRFGPVSVSEEDGAVGNQLTIVFDANHAEADGGWITAVDNVVVKTLTAENTSLSAGDADQDLDFDQLDLIQVQVAGKYLTGQTSTWGEGDWDGAPGGSPGNPPFGDGLFNQFDIVAALASDVYLQGPYGAIQDDSAEYEAQTTLVYKADTGELSVDAPSGKELTSINVTSASGRFIGAKPAVLDGAFDNFAADNLFKATFGGTFGSISFGNVLPSNIAQSDLADDLSAVGSLSGGGDLGEIDLVYVPEPASASLLIIGLAIFARSLCAQYGLRNYSRSGHSYGHKP